jgi:hypothetical protein
MTEGRFETTYNLRPPGWDNRKFWASAGSYKDDPPAGFASARSASAASPRRKQHECDEDHRQRESCPFHDLRAQGCFQYEMGMHGAHVAPIEPSRLTGRPAGAPVRTAGRGEPATSRRGVGGGLLPCDTDIAQGTGPARGGGPWTKTGKRGALSNGLFSSFEHMPGGFSERPRNVFSTERGGLLAPFRAGAHSVGAIGRSLPHQPDIYPAAGRQPAHWRLHAGLGPDAHRFPHLPEGGAPGGDEAGKQRRREISARSASQRTLPYIAPRSVSGTFSQFRPHLPDPYPAKQLREYRPPIFTYHAHQKRQNPIIVPMTYGPQTANPEVALQGLESVELGRQQSTRCAVRSLPVAPAAP